MTKEARAKFHAVTMGPETLDKMSAAYEAACIQIDGGVSDADRLRLALGIVADVQSGITDEGELRLRAMERLRRPE